VSGWMRHKAMRTMIEATGRPIAVPASSASGRPRLSSTTWQRIGERRVLTSSGNALSRAAGDAIDSPRLDSRKSP
jgi:hypothetical protein